MPAKNKEYFASNVHAAHQPIISAKIDRLVDSPNTRIKAFATVNLGGWYAIHGLRVIDSQKGLFVQMPQSSLHTKEGKLTFQDVFHPVTADARNELCSVVLDAYEQKLTEDAAQNVSPRHGGFPELGDPDPDNPFPGGDEDPTPYDVSM